MPELPEVETVRRGLKRLIVGRRVLDIKIYNDKSFDAAKTILATKLIKAEIVAVRRRGKVLIIDSSSGYSLVIHLKMTGQLVFRGHQSWVAGHPTDSFVAKLPDRSTRVEFQLSHVIASVAKQSREINSGSRRFARDDNCKLFFNDQRKFGWIKLLPTNSIDEIDFMKKLGPEPLSGDSKLPEQFLANIRSRNGTTIKAALLDQTIIAGIGNIYADESLWAAKIHPATRVLDISDRKLRELLKHAIEIMQKSIDSGGSTIKNYIKADGSRGDYLEKFANVFRRDGQPCSRCETIIQKMRVAGRGTHICPKCQGQNY